MAPARGARAPAELRLPSCRPTGDRGGPCHALNAARASRASASRYCRACATAHKVLASAQRRAPAGSASSHAAFQAPRLRCRRGFDAASCRRCRRWVYSARHGGLHDRSRYVTARSRIAGTGCGPAAPGAGRWDRPRPCVAADLRGESGSTIMLGWEHGRTAAEGGARAGGRRPLAR
jgi:hypothetical protein